MDTMTQLVELFGREKLGIASGRGEWATKRTLNAIWDFMNPKAMVFVEGEESSFNLDYNQELQLGKPEAYSLLKATRSIPSTEEVIYVGDSMEDLLMAQQANRSENR